MASIKPRLEFVIPLQLQVRLKKRLNDWSWTASRSISTMINADLKKTYEISEIPYNIKSHSFRINMISRLLQNTTIQDAANIIGHKDIK